MREICGWIENCDNPRYECDVFDKKCICRVDLMFSGNRCQETHILAICCCAALSFLSLTSLSLALKWLRSNFNLKHPGKNMFSCAYICSTLSVAGIFLFITSMLLESLNNDEWKSYCLVVLSISAQSFSSFFTFLTLSILSLLWFQVSMPTRLSNTRSQLQKVLSLKRLVIGLCFSYACFSIIVACATKNRIFCIAQSCLYEIAFIIVFCKSSKILASQLSHETAASISNRGNRSIELNHHTFPFPSIGSTFVSTLKTIVSPKKGEQRGFFSHRSRNVHTSGNLDRESLPQAHVADPSFHESSEFKDSQKYHQALEIQGSKSEDKFKVHPIVSAMRTISKAPTAEKPRIPLAQQRKQNQPAHSNAEAVRKKVQHSAQRISVWLMIKVSSTCGLILFYYFPQAGIAACASNTAMVLSLLMVHITVLKYTHRPIQKRPLSKKISSISRRLIQWKKSCSSQKSIVYSVWRFGRPGSNSRSMAKSSKKSGLSSFWSRSVAKSSQGKSTRNSVRHSFWRRKASKSMEEEQSI